MSASREKQKRLAQRIEEESLGIKRKDPKHVEKTRQTIIAVAVSAAVLVVIVFMFIGSGFLQRVMTSVTVGNVKISTAEYNFHYTLAVNNFISDVENSGYSLSDFGLDTSKSLSGQACPYDGYETWDDYFKSSAVNNVQTIVVQSEQAKKNGLSLSDASRKKLDEEVSAYSSIAKSNSMSVSHFLQTQIGKGVTLNNIRDFWSRLYLATEWSEFQADSLAPETEDIVSYYDEHKNDFDYVTYNSHTFYSVPHEDTTDMSEEEVAAAQTAANEESRKNAESMLAEVTDSESFYALSEKYTPADEDDEADEDGDSDEADDTGAPDESDEADDSGENPDDSSDETDSSTDADNATDSSVDDNGDNTTDENEDAAEDSDEEEEDPTLRKEVTYASVSDPTLQEWIFDQKRKPGDKDVISVEGDSGAITYIVVLFGERSRADYLTKNVRHILLSVDSSADAVTKEEVKAESEKLLSDWKAGEATEDSFAALAKEHSADTGSAENGGLYEDVSKGTMVAPFENWLFDDARKPGDSGIVETDFGYHIMYFVGNSSPYWQIQVKKVIVDDDYSKLMESLLESYPVKRHEFALSIA